MPNYKLLCLELADQLERSAFAHRNENESRLTFEKHIEFVEYIRATIPLGNTETAFDYKDLCDKLIERLQSSPRHTLPMETRKHVLSANKCSHEFVLR